MNTSKNCQNCGQPLTADAPGGLCPACLMKVGIGTGTGAGASDPPPAGGGASAFVPPAIEELARRFPQFEVLEMIGHGGMGAVYKVRQKSLDRVVALKILAQRLDKDPQFAERFALEAKTLARLNHPNIIAIFDYGQAEGLCYLVMEFVDGLNLRQLLQTQKIAPKEALAIVPELCAALQYAHDQGIVHRDIKPENIMLDRQGRVKIADFGLAKLLGVARQTLTPALSHPMGGGGGQTPTQGTTQQVNLTETGHFLGTPHYMAPEQIEHPQAVDHRADLFSLGVVFYEMLTGELPLGKFAPPSRKVQIDVRLDEVVLRALEKEPERRYQQASQVKTDVETISGTPRVERTSPGGDVTSSSEELPPEVKAAQRPLRLASIALLTMGVVSWWKLLFETLVAFALPRDLIEPIYKTFYALVYGLDRYLPRTLMAFSLDSHLAGTLALVAAWRVRKGRNFALANFAIILAFFLLQMPVLPLLVLLGVYALAKLWRKDVRAAFAAVEILSRGRVEEPSEAQAATRLAMASAALVLVSYICLPAFMLGTTDDVGYPFGLRSLVFWGMRWLPYWTQGIAVVLGMTALLLMRQAGGHRKGMEWAVFGTLFLPLLWITSLRLPDSNSHWFAVNPYDENPSMEKVLGNLLVATLAAAIIAGWVAHRKAKLVQTGSEDELQRFANRAVWIMGIAVVAYVEVFTLRRLFPSHNWQAPVGNLIPNLLEAAVVAALAGWLAGRKLRAWMKWPFWAVGMALVAYAGISLVLAKYGRVLFSDRVPNSESQRFFASHRHENKPAGSETRTFIAHAPSGTIELQTVCDPTDSKATCWLPDGTVRCAAAQATANHAENWIRSPELAFYLEGSGMLKDLGNLHWECLSRSQGTKETGLKALGQFDPGTRRLKRIIVRVPADAQSARLRLGFPRDSWEDTDAVWSWTGDKGALKKKSIRRANEDWEFSSAGLGDMQGALCVSYWEQVKRDAEARLVAIDTGGKIHEPEPDRQIGEVTSELVMLSQARFPNLKLSQLKELRFQVRPYRWVEFQNVSLHPGQITQVKVVDAADTPSAANGSKTIGIQPKR